MYLSDNACVICVWYGFAICCLVIGIIHVCNCYDHICVVSACDRVDDVDGCRMRD